MQLLVLQILPSVCIRAILQSPAKSSATVINLKPAPTTQCSVPVQMSAQWQTFAAPIVTVQAALIAPRSVKRLPATPLRISFLQNLSMTVTIFLKHIYLFVLLYYIYSIVVIAKEDISSEFIAHVNTYCVINMV
jgi:hypothetical protein